MKAKYIGENYLSFKNGEVYDIKTECRIVTGNQMKKPTPCLCVIDLNSSSWCPYSRLEPMLKNWLLL